MGRRRLLIETIETVMLVVLCFVIFAPMLSLLLWSVAIKWYWPHVLPQEVGLDYWKQALGLETSWAIGAVSITGWQLLDPVIAMIVASKIGWTGVRLTQRSIQGLMDASLPEAQIEEINKILDRYRNQDIRFHALRTRQAGAHSFISMHVITPGNWSIRQGHDLLESIEREIQRAIPLANVFTHIEPLEDPRSWDDPSLDSGRSPRGEMLED